MKTLLLTLLLLGAPSFDSYEWDFGTIKESDGAVSHTFVLMNDTTAPLRVARAVPSCSCIMARLPEETIAPGRIAEVEVYFSPAGAAGKVYRNVEIVGGDGHSLGVLNVSADVVPTDRSIQERYLYTVDDGLYVSRREVPFGYLGHGRTASKVIYLANVSDRTRLLEVPESDSPFLTVSCPAAIGPGSEVPVLLTYTMPDAEDYFATCSDTLRFVVDGHSAPRTVSLSVLCLDVPPSRPDAPLLRSVPSRAVMKRGVLSRVMSGTITLSNEGSSDLVIYHVEAPEGVKVNLSDGSVLRPGESVKVTASTSGASGAKVNLFTNDPLHPYKELIYQ